MDNEKVQAEQEVQAPAVPVDTTSAAEQAPEAAAAPEAEAAAPAAETTEAAPAAEGKAPYEKRPYRQNNMRGRRKKVCAFCAEKATFIDYKDAAKLRKFISERGKILPRRISRHLRKAPERFDNGDQESPCHRPAALCNRLKNQ